MSSLDHKVSELFHVLKLDKASRAAVTFLKVVPLSVWYSRGTVSVVDITSGFLPLCTGNLQFLTEVPIFYFLCLWPILNMKGWGCPI